MLSVSALLLQNVFIERFQKLKIIRPLGPNIRTNRRNFAAKLLQRFVSTKSTDQTTGTLKCCTALD